MHINKLLASAGWWFTRGLVAGTAVLVVFVASPSAATPPVELVLQGRLTNSQGDPLSAAMNIDVCVLNHATNGNPSAADPEVVYRESHTGLQVVNGYYSIAVGTGTPTAGNLEMALKNNAALWMTLNVAGDGWMAPRVAVRAAPYAVNARTLEGSRYQKASGADPAGSEGDLLYRTDTDIIKVYNGMAWVPFDVNLWDRPSAGVLTPKTAGDVVRSGNGSAATPAFSFAADPNTGMYGDGADALLFATAGTERARIAAGGNFALGTTSASHKLTIAGGGAAIGLDNTAIIQAKNSGGTYENVLWPRHSDDVTYMNYGTGGFNIRNNASASTLFMTNAGNVGIGNAAPGAKLDVTGPASGTGITIRAAGGGDVVLASGGSLFFDNNYSYAAGNYIRPVAANTQAFFTAGAERMRITSTGLVGIGTTPTGKLDVLAGAARSGTHGATPSFYVTGTLTPGTAGPAANNIEFRHDNGTQGIGFGYNTIYQTGSNANQELNIQSRGTSPITLNAFPGYSTGNVGIATAAPDELLHVAGANAGDGAHIGNAYIGNWDGSNAYATVVHNSIKGTAASYALLQHSSGQTFLNAAAGQPIFFRTGNVDRMHMTTAGKVGIGTTTPAAGAILDLTSDGESVLVPRKSTAGDPAAGSSANGMIYYNSSTQKFRGRQNGAWVNLIGGTGSGGGTDPWAIKGIFNSTLGYNGADRYTGITLNDPSKCYLVCISTWSWGDKDMTTADMTFTVFQHNSDKFDNNDSYDTDWSDVELYIEFRGNGPPFAPTSHSVAYNGWFQVYPGSAFDATNTSVVLMTQTGGSLRAYVRADGQVWLRDATAAFDCMCVVLER